MNLDPEDLKRVEEAEVRRAGERAGWLRRTREGTEFSYDPAYAGPAVATTLPTGRDPVRCAAGAVPPFFAGLLPEGRRLVAVRAALKTSADDDFSLLLATGHSTIGSVQVLPLGAELPGPPVPRPLSTVRFRELLREVLGPPGLDRVGLPGVQDKVSGAMISLPVALDLGPSIVKLTPPGYAHLVENEAFFLDAARTSGVPAAEATLVYDADGVPGLVVRRFDRVAGHGEPQVLSQEDACQVLGLYPADKYRVTTEDVLVALSSHAGAPRACALSFLRQAAFAYLTHNGDAHAKNFAILRDPTGEWGASPAYDLPSSHPYGDHSMALPVNGKRRDDIGREDFLALGARVSLPTRAVTQALDELVDRAPRWLARLDELPFDQRRRHKLRRAIEHRRERLGSR